MNQSASRKPSPASTDAEGWRAAAADGSLAGYRLEALVEALQDLGAGADAEVKRALAKRLSDGLMRMLRRFVGTNHPNRGDDIIYRVHGELFDAILDAGSADGRAMRAGFASIVSFRVKDAVAVEGRHSRIPVRIEVKRPGKDKMKTDTVRVVPATEPSEAPNDTEATDGEEALARDSNRDLSLLDGVRAIDEQIEVDRILELVPDDQKRLAFRLYLDRVPFTSTKGNSIAKALGVSGKTAALWVDDVRELLKLQKAVQNLRKLSAGDSA